MLIAPLHFLGAISMRYTGTTPENMPGETTNQELVNITQNNCSGTHSYLYRLQENL